MSTIRYRFGATLALALALPLASPPDARAFDLEDYATTLRATRDAWLKASREVELALPHFLAARLIAKSWGVNVDDSDIPLGVGLRPDWCGRYTGPDIGHGSEAPIEGAAVTGGGALGYDFYGRGHGLHDAGRGGGHYHATTASGLDDLATDFIEGYPPLSWFDTVSPGTSARTSELVGGDLAWYEANGTVQRRCQTCEACAPDEPCDDYTMFCLPESAYGYCEWRYEPTCTTKDGQRGHTRYTECLAPVTCDGYCCPSGSTCNAGWQACQDGDGNYVDQTGCTPAHTVEEALAILAEDGYAPADAQPNQCVAYWVDGGNPTKDDVYAMYRAHRDAMTKALNELSLATPPFRAATAAYAAALEAYATDTPCGTWGLPNLPELPNPFAQSVPR